MFVIVKAMEFSEALEIKDGNCIFIDFIFDWLFHFTSLFFDILFKILSFFVSKARYWDSTATLSDDPLLPEVKQIDNEKDREPIE